MFEVADKAGRVAAPSGRFGKWLDQRIPPSTRVTLHQKNIFILPTRHGLYFVLMILAMMLAGINYLNSLIFALAFLLTSLFMVSILHTFRNLSGITLQGHVGNPVFTGEDIDFVVTLSREGARTYEGVLIGWHGDMKQTVDLLDEQIARQRVYVPTKRRGRFNPGRMLVETTYPVGLFRAWSWVDLDIEGIVYPRPIAAGEIPMAEASGDEGEMIRRDGVDDFYGLREYQQGDGIRHIAWKTFARTEELQVKEFAAHVDQRVWLEWDALAGMDREARLSRLTWWVLQLSKSNDEYGLRLPGLAFSPDRGREHMELLLTNLALFELDR
jgi:uncharacterized protein (DUF58 family)